MPARSAAKEMRVCPAAPARPSRPLAMVLTAVATLLMPASVSAKTGRVRYVTDGDTFRLESGERIRIAGIDAPETHADQAHCGRELARGRISAERSCGMINGRDVRFERVGSSYNGTVARVWIGDRDPGRALVAVGAARWWQRFTTKLDWCGTS